MEALLSAHETLSSRANLSATLTTVDSLISLLQTTRSTLNPENLQPTPKLIGKPLKNAFSTIEDSLKEVNKGLNTYQKALKEKFKKEVVGLYPAADATDDAGATGSLVGAGLAEAEGKKGLVERAVAMHLLREGHFDVARTFVREVGEGMWEGEGGYEWLGDFVDSGEDLLMGGEESEEEESEDDEDLYGGGSSVVGKSEKGHLQRKFAEMYRILSALRENHDLEPAIRWAQRHGTELGQRASNLEFELARLRFVELYTSAPSSSEMQQQESAFTGPILALEYARTVFPRFHPRYTREISSLLGALAFSPDVTDSPYANLFSQPSWDSVAISQVKAHY
ncbi:hypothetical protein LTR97_008320 [Elasticomyces elasticus]|uniref:CTLH domain-containing protein n=1 Tax=Elasticomyces elasticus TaxID=574655 RepID=A0AAN7W4Z0_9PEZI|nr:hypothetical protein LTR97_008320 [Elasticomyces elasticus]